MKMLCVCWVISVSIVRNALKKREVLTDTSELTPKRNPISVSIVRNVLHEEVPSYATSELTPKRDPISVSIVRNVMHEEVPSYTTSELTPKRNNISVSIVRNALDGKFQQTPQNSHQRETLTQCINVSIVRNALQVIVTSNATSGPHFIKIKIIVSLKVVGKAK